MARKNESSWFPVKMFYKNGASADMALDKNTLFGPALQNETTSYLYKNEKIRKDETVLWNPDKHITISLKGYERAHQDGDIELLGKITEAGFPLGCTFGGCITLKKQ